MVASWSGVRILALGQGGYYVATGLWAWIHLATFEAVTGPKTDDWLVQTVGILVVVIGAVLLSASRRPSVAIEAALLGGGSAGAFVFVELFFFFRGTIGLMYVADAVLELMFVLAWVVLWAAGPPNPEPSIKPPQVS